MNSFKKYLSLAEGVLVVIALIPAHALALSQAQQQLQQEGINFFLQDAQTCSNGGVTVPAGNLPSLVPEPYNGDFTAAGKAYNVSPILIASIFTEEHFTNQSTGSLTGDWKGLSKSQPDPNSGWATSSDDAMGPFQFIPSTWASLGVDADHNGVKDVENLLDASFGAAHYMAVDGATADTPKSKWVSFADGYSGHTAGYADHVSQYIDFYASGGTNTSSSSDTGTADGTTDTDGCSSPGAVAGSIVQTALAFAWDDYGHPGGHTFDSRGTSEAKPAYVSAVAQYETDTGSDPAGYTTDYTDCGAFVATVMRASGVDPNYEQLGTSSQLAYVKKHPNLYKVYAPGQWAVSDVQPGDIFITDGHTYIYVGKQPDGYSVAEASQNDHVPEIDAQPYASQDIGSGLEEFSLVRYIGPAVSSNTNDGGAQ